MSGTAGNIETKGEMDFLNNEYSIPNSRFRSAGRRKTAPGDLLAPTEAGGSTATGYSVMSIRSIVLRRLYEPFIPRTSDPFSSINRMCPTDPLVPSHSSCASTLIPPKCSLLAQPIQASLPGKSLIHSTLHVSSAPAAVPFKLSPTAISAAPHENSTCGSQVPLSQRVAVLARAPQKSPSLIPQRQVVFCASAEPRRRKRAVKLVRGGNMMMGCQVRF